MVVVCFTYQFAINMLSIFWATFCRCAENYFIIWYPLGLYPEDNAMTSLTKGCGADCLIGCLKVLADYNLFSSAYETLYVVYKTVLTLPMTQVCCERSFSQLKMIKTRLRNALRQDNLEAYMLMKLNRQWTDEVVMTRYIEISIYRTRYRYIVSYRYRQKNIEFFDISR
jgi:hypothetical protein